MAAFEIDVLQGQLQERKRRLETAIGTTPDNRALDDLLTEVDSALAKMAAGVYGQCESCHEPVEPERLLADPLCRYCLDHLTAQERSALQRDLDLAAQVQRGLLPSVCAAGAGWETKYHYLPVGAVSGDYCDLYVQKDRLAFVIGDVSGKGVAASMRMAQLHALFRSLIDMGLPLGDIVAHINRFLCDSGFCGQYATLVCGYAKESGEVEFFNAGHLPVIVLHRGEVQLFESTSLPLGMFRETRFSSSLTHLEPGDLMFLCTDGVSEARRDDDEYGLERLTQLITCQALSSPSEVISACLDDLQGFVGDGPQTDDLTLLAMRRVV